MTSSKSQPVLVVENLSAHFGDITALLGISATLTAGEILGVVGPNGAGKTTLLNCLSGLVPTTVGTIAFQGRSLAGLAPHRRARRGIGRTFQEAVVFQGLSPRDNIRLGHDLGRPPREPGQYHPDSAQVAGGLPRGPTALLGPRDRKRLELARVLASRPTLLLLDEPSGGLPSADADELADGLRRLKAQNLAILLVDHRLPMVLAVADHILALDAGRIAFLGPTADFRRPEPGPLRAPS